MGVAGKKTIAIFALAALCSWGLAATAWSAELAQPRVEYSADQVVTGDGQSFQSKVYHARDKQRMEMSANGSGQVVITRLDKKVSWVLIPDQKMYMETSLGQASQKAPKDPRECAMKTTKAGTETVNGHSTTRYNMEATCPDSNRYRGSVWTTKDYIMVKMDAIVEGGSGAGRRVVTELKNLKIGKQDPALFEVPKGYSNVVIPASGGFGGFMGGAAAPTTNPPAGQAAPEASGQGGGRSYTAQPRTTGSTPSGGAPRVKKGEAEQGRSYTAGGRSYTSQPRDSGSLGKGGTLDRAIDTGKKLKGLFGW